MTKKSVRDMYTDITFTTVHQGRTVELAVQVIYSTADPVYITFKIEQINRTKVTWKIRRDTLYRGMGSTKDFGPDEYKIHCSGKGDGMVYHFTFIDGHNRRDQGHATTAAKPLLAFVTKTYDLISDQAATKADTASRPRFDPPCIGLEYLGGAGSRGTGSGIIWPQ